MRNANREEEFLTNFSECQRIRFARIPNFNRTECRQIVTWIRRRFTDSLRVNQRVFCSAGLAVPYCRQNISIVHDLFVPFLKSFQYQFPWKFLPVGKKLLIADAR